MRRLLTLSTLLVLCLSTVSQMATANDKFIILQSTTSTQNSGLLNYILPIFTKKTGIDVRVVAVGTGQALKNAQNGDGDVLMVHAKAAEEKFVAEGYGVERHELMYNDFVIIGPNSDPAKIAGSNDASASLKKIAETASHFASRGDDSGTHKKELALWKVAGIDVKSANGWYRETGSGMGSTLNIAAGMNAYVMSDRATWISFKNKADLKILVEGDKSLFNQYSVILVNPEKHKNVKVELAQQFISWVLGPEGQAAIKSFKVNGEQLFTPNATDKELKKAS